MPYKDKDRQRQFNREWKNQRRQDWIELNGPCAQCGSIERLEVDHKDRGSKVTHNVWSWSESRRNAELSKCQVLCYTCHKAKTISELTLPPDHGTSTEYKNGCRCNPCRAAQAQYMRKWRSSRA